MTIPGSILTGGKALSGEGARLARARTAESQAEYALRAVPSGPQSAALKRRFWAAQAALRQQEAAYERSKP